MDRLPPSDDELHAYIDGVLSAARHREIAMWLDHHPAVATRFASYAAQRDAIREALSPAFGEPLPPQLDLRARIREKGSRRFAHRRSAAMAAVAAGLMLASGIGGWTLHGWMMAPRAGIGALAREAVENYNVYAPDTARPVEIEAVRQVDFDRWISKRIGHPLETPDLSRAGYRLLGGRLVATPHGPAALFLYENRHAERVAMLVRPMDIDRTARMTRHDEIGVDGYAWADDGIGFSLVGTGRDDQLHVAANEARRQFGALQSPI